MQGIELKYYKDEIRSQMRKIRLAMPPGEKKARDLNILKNIKSLNQYDGAKTLLCYISLPAEVDTMELIKTAWGDGKKVAVPRVKGGRFMEFYCIDGFDGLEKGRFGTMEPVPERSAPYFPDSGDICIVPALCYDLNGYRIGYGGGFYDKFLTERSVVKVGIIYVNCVKPRINYGRFDIPIDILVTERYIRTIKK